MIPNYRISGPNEAPPLVLSHSIATNLHMWDRALPLLEQDFRVIRYDARGHGDTGASGTECTIATLQDDVVALLDHLGIERAHFAGLSLGGMTGIGLGLDHPERLFGLVICNASAETPAASRASWDDRIAQVRTDGIEALIEPTLTRWFTEAMQSDQETMDWMRAIMRTTSPDGYACGARAVQSLDLKKRLGEMTVPTLYLTGEQDAGASPQVVEEMQNLTPGSRFITIASAAHMSAVEQPIAVGTAIADFLNSLSAAPK